MIRVPRPLYHPIVVLVVMVLAVVSGACSDSPGTVDTTSPVEAISPEDVVKRLLAAVNDGRFEDAATFTDTSQAALLTLVEGADVSDVAEAIRGGGTGVAANFWSGFAQTLEVNLVPEALEITAEPETTIGDNTFVRVNVEGGDAEARYFVLRRDDGWRIDLIASFGSVLADRLVLPIDKVLESANPDAVLVLDRLRSVAPSVRVALEQTGIRPETQQSLLALLERVTRTGS